MKTIGLDFGTTNTRLSFSGSPWRYPLTQSGLLPSAVAFLPNGKMIIGESARDRLAIDPVNVIPGPKRLIGTRFLSRETKHFRELYETAVENNAGEPAFVTRCGTKTPEEISAEIIRHSILTADVTPESTSIAMTVPVAFGERRSKALSSVARQIGFKRIRLLAEPVATAVAYSGQCNVRRAAVFDLGGGTFDFAVLGATGQQQNINVLAYSGDDMLGSEDIDRLLADWIASHILEKTGWDLKSEKMIFARVTAMAERAKIALTRAEEVTIDLNPIDDASPVVLPRVTISRDYLYDLALSLIQRMFLVCDEVLYNAKTNVTEIDAVFLSGSGAIMPGIRGAVTQYFNRPVRNDIDPSFVVSIGAGLAMARPSLHSLFVNI